MLGPRAGRWATVLAAGLFLAVGTGHVAYRLAVPSDGAQLAHGGALAEALAAPVGAPRGLPVVVREPSPDGLRDGDRVLRLDGVNPASVARSPLDLGDSTRLGRPTATFAVVRAGAGELTIVVERRPFPIAARLADDWATILFAGVLLGLGGLVFRVRPDDPSARALLLFAASTTGSLPSLSLGLEAQDLVAGPGPLLALGGAVAYASTWAAMVWFSVAFARPRRLGRFLAGAALALGAAGVTLSILVVAAGVGAGEPVVAWIARLGWVGDRLGLLALPLVPVAFLIGYRDNPDWAHRLRIRSVAGALGGAAAVGLFLVYLPPLVVGHPVVPWSVVSLLALPIPVAIGWAILRHAAFDLRLVVNRSLVYGGLTLAILAIYGVGLSIAGSLLLDQAGTIAGLLATGLVAVLGQPVRDALQRAANQLVYGDRDDPYAALNRLGRRLEASLSPDAVLDAITESVRAALRLPWVAVELAPIKGVPAIEGVPAAERPARDGERIPLVHGGTWIGWLVLGRRAEPLDGRERRLLDGLLAHVTGAVQGVRLARQLQRSRERLVLAQEEERRRIRNELHDGIGQSLAALGLALEAIRPRLADDPDRARRELDRLVAAMRAAIEDLRALAAGLEEEAGFLGAAQARAGGTTEAIRSRWPEDEARPADGIGWRPPGVEVATDASGPWPGERRAEVAPPAATRSRTARWTRAARASFLLGLVLVAASTAVTVARLARPSDGWGLAAVSAGWLSEWHLVFDRPYLPGADPGLRRGDRLLAIDGIPAERVLEAALSGAALPLGAAQGSSVYTVERGGAAFEVRAELRPMESSALLGAFAGWTLVNPSVVPLFVLGVFVHLRRPESVAARLLYLFGAAFLANAVTESIGGVSPRVADLRDPLLFWSHALLANLIWVVLIAPLWLHTVLEFPSRARALDRHPLLIGALLYLVFPIVALGLVALPDPPLASWERAIAAATAWNLGLIVAAVARLAYLLASRRAPPVAAQVRWIAWGMLITFGLALASAALLYVGLLSVDTTLAASRLYVLVMPATLAVALLRHRLFDIDVVLNRTLVYGALTAAIVALYGAVVGTASAIAGGVLGAPGPFVPASFAAAVVIAVLAEPLRAHFQRAANRLVYGARDDPYAVLARLGDRLSAAVNPSEALPAAIETIGQALGVPYVALEIAGPEGTVRIERGTPAAPPERGAPVRPPEEIALSFQGEPIGTLVVGARSPGEPFGALDRRLLADLARPLGVAVHAARAWLELERAGERLAIAIAEERRRLRRDLHDGLGPILSGGALQIEAGRRVATTDTAAASQFVESARRTVRLAIVEIRRIVHGLRPPALDDLGLVGAIRRHAETLSSAGAMPASDEVPATGVPPAGRRVDRVGALPEPAAADGIIATGTAAGPPTADAGRLARPLEVVVEAPARLPELPAAVEVAALRIALEALTNVTRHAGASRAVVRLSVDDGLRLEIADDGLGMAETSVQGVGLASMRARAAELGGRCRIESTPGAGTRVVAVLPLARSGDRPAARPAAPPQALVPRGAT